MKKWWNSVQDRIRKSWADSLLQRVRLISCGVLIVMSLTGFVLSALITVPVYFNLFSISVALINVGAMYWPPIYGRLFNLFHRRHVRLVIEIGAQHLAPSFTYGGTWYEYRMIPEVRAWCDATLSGRYGTVPRIDEFHGFSEHREFWFSNPDDAFAFKLRWVGASDGL
jgi:hypothetical protein